jgi:site-specific DNA-methyltransferase (adenine-specific)
LDPPTKGNHRKRRGIAHPTEKPKKIIRDIITHHFSNNLRILDPFAGSGTTLVVAEEMGIPAMGIEIDENYFWLAVDRVKQVAASSKLESFFVRKKKEAVK